MRTGVGFQLELKLWQRCIDLGKTHMYDLGKLHSQTKLALYVVVSMVLNPDMLSYLLTVNQNVFFSISDLSHKQMQFYC